MILFYNPRSETKEIIDLNFSNIATVTPNKLFDNNNNDDNVSLLVSTSDIICEINKVIPHMFRWGRDINNLEVDIFLISARVEKAMKKLLHMNIKVCIFETNVDHHIHTSCTVIALKLLNIPQIFLYRSVFHPAIIPLIQHRGIEDRKVLKWRNDCISKVFRHEIDNFINNFYSGQPPEINVKVGKMNSNFWYAVLSSIFYDPVVKFIIKRKISTPSFFLEGKSFLSNINLVFRQRSAISFYDKVLINKIDQSEFNGSVSLMILAHFQPEATTYPEGGGVYRNHISIVQELRRVGFKGKIYYKEHPATRIYRDNVVGPTLVGMARSTSYYKELLSLGVRLISDSISTREMLSNSSVIPVTITGTVAIERAIEGNKTLVFGYPWFRDMPGVILFSSFGGSFLNKIDASTFNKNDIEVAKNCKTWLKNSIEANFIDDHLSEKNTNREFVDFLSFVQAEYNDYL